MPKTPTPAPPEAEPVHQGALISRKVIRRRNGTVEVIEKFAKPPRWRWGPLRVVEADPVAGTLDLSDGTKWSYDPTGTNAENWARGALVAIRGRGMEREMRNRLFGDAITVTKFGWPPKLEPE